MPEIRRDCPCKKRKCPRHGDCDACRLHHEKDDKYPVYCERAAKKAKNPKD